MLRTLRKRLAFRLGLGLFLATAAILVVAGVWNLRLQRAHLTQLVKENAAERAEDIRWSLREAMMHNRPNEVRRLIETIASQPTIERIRLFDKRSRISASSETDEIGSQVDIAAEQCVLCHRADETLERFESVDTTRIFETAGGRRILGVVAPVRNEPGCAEADCHAHPASKKILGVLDVQLSLDQVDASVAASERQMLLGLLATALAVLAAVWLLTWNMVLDPVKRLTEATAKVAAGDLSTHIPVTSTDEIGEMTGAWNSMLAKLGRAQTQLEDWGATLEEKVEEKTEELNEAHQRMLQVEKMASLGKLSAVVAHEINTPLTGIGTYTRLLRKRLSASPEAMAGAETTSPETGQILKLIEHESHRCAEIVRNLLLSSRTPAVSFEREDLEPLLNRCVLLLEPQAQRAGIRLKAEAQADLPRLSCDASQIQQMILALALNGIEATPEGGQVKISARLAESGEGMILEVTDTGKGISEGEMDRIFEPFYTTKEEGGGIGLGLAVVYGIIERHHGTTDVESLTAGGTRFTVRLPLEQPPANGEGMS